MTGSAAARITGWAIRDKTGILARTVGPTRRSAVVNWLVAERGMMITNGHSDALIEQVFQAQSGSETRARAVTVEIAETGR